MIINRRVLLFRSNFRWHHARDPHVTEPNTSDRDALNVNFVFDYSRFRFVIIFACIIVSFSSLYYRFSISFSFWPLRNSVYATPGWLLLYLISCPHCISYSHLCRFCCSAPTLGYDRMSQILRVYRNLPKKTFFQLYFRFR